MRGYSTDAVRRAFLLALPMIALALWLWTSAELPPAPHVPSASSSFTAAQIARGRDYREPGYLIIVATLAAQLAVAWALAWRGRELAARLPATVAAFAVALVVGATALPFGYWLHRRAADAGLDLQSDAAWLRDALLATVIAAVAVAVVYAAGRVAYRRAGPIGVALAAWAAVALFTLLQPLVIDPLFISTRPLPAAQAAEARTLERRMGVHPASVTVSNASTRSSEENASVDGLGPTVRVIIDDTSLREPPAEFRALLAHELGHVQRLHTLKGVLWFGVIGVPAILLVLAAAARLTRGSLLSASAVPVVLACAVTASIALLPVENLLSRRIEAEADWAGLRATRDGPAMAALQRRLALRDLANPSPPVWAVWLLFDHPPTMDRIAVARAYSSSSSGSS
jgi:Zn-dependent protease with chaperone function